MEIKPNGTQPSAKGLAENFTGTVRVPIPMVVTRKIGRAAARLRTETDAEAVLASLIAGPR